MGKKKNSVPVIENIESIEYADEMKKSFIDYSMTVIEDRALPDVRDGLKPVHRRILYDMHELGFTPEKAFKKSARIVGDVLGKYHPHGDSAVYESMVRMSQDWIQNIPTVLGHGNFGSIDGDSAAAMRYTEAKLAPSAMEMLADLEKGVVDFQPNYDDTLKEPKVLPSKFPNLLVNGVSGIAVGMASSMPPHNLVEVVNGILATMDNPDITIAKIMKYIKGPDYPTGGVIINKSELLSIYETGTGKNGKNGKIRIRAKFVQEDAGYGKTNIIITEIPYTSSGSKTTLITKIEDQIKDKKMDELMEIRDESSSREGMRIVLEVRKGVNIEKFMNKLYKKTRLEETDKAHFLTLVDRQPKVLNIKEIIIHFIEFQKEITLKKHQYLLNKANERLEIVDGLIKAHDLIDVIVEVLRGSTDTKTAKQCLMEGNIEGIRFKTKKSEKIASKLSFTERQTQAILDMRLQKLIGLEMEKLTDEHSEILRNMELYRTILGDEQALLSHIKDYLKDISKRFGQKRKTLIVDLESEEYVEEFIEEDVYVLIDRFGYVKTTDVASYNRASEDTINEYRQVFFAKNSDKISIFTKEGNLHSVKLTDVPKGKIKDKGVPIDTLVKIGKEEILLIDMCHNLTDKKLLFITKKAMIKQIPFAEFETNRSTIASTKVEDADELFMVRAIEKEEVFTHIVLISNNRFALKMEFDSIPELKKTSKGVKTITLSTDDYLTDIHLMNKKETEVLIDVDGKSVNLKSMKTKKRNNLGVKL